ncbi:unnamed protein product [Callosobruchus maculatus]|uniref:Uncharacterized protein n=1 Tax=Callosobruchus maculatus TaxID=64391 RepID=A0A653C2S9_CALMS|nr:unnamed protein product [Callosobruchus maculatus]
MMDELILLDSVMTQLDEFGSSFVKRRIIIVADLLKSQNHCHCQNQNRLCSNFYSCCACVSLR